MSPASDTTPSAQLTKNHEIKEEWKRNVWTQRTVTRLLTEDDRMVKLKSKEKKSSKVYSVHKALLCFYSPYHDKLLNGEFAEGLVAPTKPLVINAGASVLKLFLTWLYTGKVDLAPSLEVKNPDFIDKWHTGTAKLYIFADEINCVALQRSIMSKLVKSCKKANGLVGVGTVDLLSNSSLESSGLYQYYLNAFNAHWGGTWDNGERDRFNAKDPMPPHFAYRLLLKRVQKPRIGETDSPCCHDPCRYHSHESEQERKATCGSDDGFEVEQEELLNFESESESESGPESSPDIECARLRTSQLRRSAAMGMEVQPHRRQSV